MEKKYELIPSDKAGLYRIKALKDFADVKVGDIGGYVSGEHNLSHDDTCWIYHNAQVYDNARVSGHALVYGNALVYSNAQVYGSAQVYDSARVYDNARVSDYARVSGNARIYSGTIKSTNDYMTIGPIGSRDAFTTFFKDEDKIMVSCGCFNGTIQEFETQVKEIHQDNKFAKQYLSAILCCKTRI